MEPRLLTVDEVAELLRIKRDTVYRLAARGEIAGHKIGRVWRFPKEFIDDFLKKPPDPTPDAGNLVESERVTGKS